jgi:hypothetical protein
MRSHANEYVCKFIKCQKAVFSEKTGGAYEVLEKVLKNAPGVFGHCEETGVKTTSLVHIAM